MQLNSCPHFTKLLCISPAQYCFPDQFLNIQTFSILRHWLLNTWSFQQGQLLMEIPVDKPQGESILPQSFSPFSEKSFDEQMLTTYGASDLYEEISDRRASSSPSNSPSLSDITQAFTSSRPSTPVMGRPSKDDDDNVSISERSNLSDMRQVFGSESSFLSDVGTQDSNLAKKAITYCYRLLRQSECSK